MAKNRKTPDMNLPVWFDGQNINEALFCEEFLHERRIIFAKADASISSKDFYEIYRMWCEENSLAPLKARSFSDAMIANAGRFNLEHCNNITNSAGRRVWGFMGVEAVARPHINGFYDVSSCTYVPEEWRD